MRSIFHAGSTRRRRAAKRIPPSPLYSYAGTWEDAGRDENTQKCEAFFTRVRHAEGGTKADRADLYTDKAAYSGSRHSLARQLVQKVGKFAFE
ncbi:MAG TPA: hypothetical protein PLW42_06575 [Anaerohalosphaeraceae bacterium]|nr:hypothetical protein [Anaerohalosphaeraceae bacterium]HQJ67943.1 hypothetical protein [Anaerohalosphaeraceae bacterium]